MVIGLVVGIAISSFFNLQNVFIPSEVEFYNPKIFCSAEGSVSSSWFRSYEGNRTKLNPVVGEVNVTEVPEIRLSVNINNNNSISLFNLAIELSYRTIDNSWNSTTKTNLGFVDAKAGKHIEIPISNPYVSLWETKRAVYYDPNTHWENVTVHTFDLDDVRVIAYGYAEP